MIGGIQGLILGFVLMTVLWCVVILVSVSRADRGGCACGRFLVDSGQFTEYDMDEDPTYVHTGFRCFPYLEEIV